MNIQNKQIVSISHINDILDISYELKQSVFLWGDPGIGKSSCVKEWCKKMNQKDPSFSKDPIDIRLSLKDPSDIQGLPTFKKVKLDNGLEITTTEWSLPSDFPRDPSWKGVIFLDEFNLSSPSVMNACYSLIESRKINNIQLPEGSFIITAGNPPESNINATVLPQALNNRFVHFYLEEDFNSWISYAKSKDLDNRIISFLQDYPELFLDKDSLIDMKDIYATPRSWEKVSNVLKSKYSDDLKKLYIKGLIGNNQTEKLFNYLNNVKDIQIIDFNDILNGKIKSYDKDIPADQFLTLVKNITYNINKASEDDKEKFSENVREFLDNLKNKEFKSFAYLKIFNETIGE